MTNTYIQDKLDEFDKTIGGSGFYQDALGIENYKEIRNFLKQSLTDYHNHIVEKIQKDLDNGRFYEICSHENSFMKYMKSLLQDTNPKE